MIALVDGQHFVCIDAGGSPDWPDGTRRVFFALDAEAARTILAGALYAQGFGNAVDAIEEAETYTIETMDAFAARGRS